MIKILEHGLVRVLQGVVALYRVAVSPLFGPCCRFYPTCSAYCQVALARHGAVKGLFFALRRILACHPWSGRQGYDPVPKHPTGWFDRPGDIGYNPSSLQEPGREQP